MQIVQSIWFPMYMDFTLCPASKLCYLTCQQFNVRPVSNFGWIEVRVVSKLQSWSYSRKDFTWQRSMYFLQANCTRVLTEYTNVSNGLLLHMAKVQCTASKQIVPLLIWFLNRGEKYVKQWKFTVWGTNVTFKRFLQASKLCNWSGYRIDFTWKRFSILPASKMYIWSDSRIDFRV